MAEQLQAGLLVAARELRELAVMFGILTDKRRLADGHVTDRTEQTTVPAREIIEAKIEELQKRKKQREADELAEDRKKPSPPDQ